MGIYTKNTKVNEVSEKSITESFLEAVNGIERTTAGIVYTEETIPVFQYDDSYVVEMDMVCKLMESKDCSLTEAVKAICEENEIDGEKLTVVIDPEEVEDYADEDKIEEMMNLINEAWKNNIKVAAKDDKGKYVELTINGEKTKVKVKKIDKMIEQTKKKLAKAEEMAAWWGSLSDEEKKKESTKRKIVIFTLLGLQFITAIFSGAAGLIGSASAISSIVIGTVNIAGLNGKNGIAAMDTDNIVDHNGDKIYKNTDDYLKRMIDLYKKIIKALEDYQKKNVK